MDEDDKIKTAQYDKFFKKLISKIENAKSLIEFTLDKDLLSNIDLSSIRPIDTQKISGKYKQLYMDVAFRVKLKDQEAQVYFIIEHKSESFTFTPLQILSYMLSVWELDQKNGKPFEPIIPIVFYHGQEPWNNPVSFADYFKNKELFKPYIPDFKYILTDTSQISDEFILQAIDNIELKAATYFLKHIFKKDIRFIKQTFEILKLLEDPTNTTIIMFADYIIHLPDYDEEEVDQALKETLGGDKVAPLVDKWLNQGRQEGKQEGLLEGMEKGMEKGMIVEAQELLLDVIEAKVGEVPKDIRLLVLNTKDRQKLKTLHKGVIKAQNLDEIRKLF